MSGGNSAAHCEKHHVYRCRECEGAESDMEHRLYMKGWKKNFYGKWWHRDLPEHAPMSAKSADQWNFHSL